MSVFEVHKPGQGKLSRTTVLLGGLFFLAWGCRSLLMALPRAWAPLGDAWNEILDGAPPSAAIHVDLLVIPVTKFSPALVVAALALVVTGLLWYRMVNRPKLAGALVDMEAELRKVSWPTFPDAWQSTLVVSGFTALVVVLIFGYDLVIKGFVDLVATPPRTGI